MAKRARTTEPPVPVFEGLSSMRLPDGSISVSFDPDAMRAGFARQRQEAADLAATFAPGEEVVFAPDVSPSHLAGVRARVVRRLQVRVRLELLEPSTSFAAGEVVDVAPSFLVRPPTA